MHAEAPHGMCFPIKCCNCSSPQPRKEFCKDPNPSSATSGGEGESSSAGAKMRSSSSTGVHPRSNISAGLQRLLRSIKSLSQLFAVYKGEGGEDELDEEVELVIGFPTDVQHVSHIGIDGSSDYGQHPIISGLKGDSQLLSLQYYLHLGHGCKAAPPM